MGSRYQQLEMWANAQRDGRPAKYRWRPLFNAAVWLTLTIRVQCSNAAKTRNPLKLPGMPQTRKQISAVSRPKFTTLSGHVEEVLLFNIFFPIVNTCLSCEDIVMARYSNLLTVGILRVMFQLVFVCTYIMLRLSRHRASPLASYLSLCRVRSAWRL